MFEYEIQSERSISVLPLFLWVVMAIKASDFEGVAIIWTETM